MEGLPGVLPSNIAEQMLSRVCPNYQKALFEDKKNEGEGRSLSLAIVEFRS
jgi:hypothetical protein